MKKKIIRDTIYTYIEIDENIKTIIDSRSFQRLKNIKQLTIQHLYPSANHTRFEHSLGVMHLSLLVYERINEQLNELIINDKQLSLFENKNEITNHLNSLREHLLYASLLHDVGHPPFSHAGEKFYIKKDIMSKLKKELEINNYTFSINFLNDQIGSIASHELMSCYIIIKKFYRKIKLLFDKKYTTYYTLDIEFIFRIICGIKYTIKNNDDTNIIIRNIIISIVHSDSIDVDKIDYLLRDNKMVGYIGPQVDVKRLIMSITINKYKSDSILFTPMGISALQGLIDCRDILYLWVFNHHTVVYTDFLYQSLFMHFNKHYIQKSNCLYDEWMALRSIFSCEAIADDCVSDSDAISTINKIYKTIKKGIVYSDYIQILINQLMNRKYLKPIWKTLNQYNDFLDECLYKNIKQKTKLADYFNSWRNRVQILLNIEKILNIDHGNIFIIVRENKFGEKILNKLSIIINDDLKLIKDLLPFKNYEERYQKTAFYVYCEEKYIIQVKNELKNILMGKKKDILAK